MEIAIIDWKTIDSRFVKDDLLEHFNAPQWVDFLAPNAPVDDDAWFCKPDCNHPKTVEDFYKVTTPSSSSKLQRSASVSDIPLGERNRRDATAKKRGQIQPSVSLISLNKDLKYDKIVEDSENQNPNFATPPRFRTKLMKQTIKSSAEKKPVDDNISLQKEQQIPKLRSTLSARNLFAGGDLLNKVTDFCNELKKLVTIRNKEKENGANENLETSPLMGNKQKAKDCIVEDEQRERKPLLEMTKETNETVSKSIIKEKQKRKLLLRNDNEENTPILVDVKNIKRKDEDILSQIRTNPPTPQCFSASRGTTKTTPSKAKYRPLETRGILQELEQSSNEEKRKEDQGKMMSYNKQGQRGGAIVAEKEARVVLAENGRLKHIDAIAKRFAELTMAHKGELKATVTTVIPLPLEEEKELKETLQDVMGKGKKVNIEQKIDPSILGGLVIEFGPKVFDMSIRTRARQMERLLKEPLNF